jgi:hypothetical protein
VFGNAFEAFTDKTEDVSGALQSVSSCERKRMCEYFNHSVIQGITPGQLAKCE